MKTPLPVATVPRFRAAWAWRFTAPIFPDAGREVLLPLLAVPLRRASVLVVPLPPLRRVVVLVVLLPALRPGCELLP